jgi:hypothetical protein
MAAYKPGYGQIGRDYALRMFTMPVEEDGPVWMVNLMKYKEVAAYTDGNPKGISGKEADDRYAPIKILHEIGALVPFFGDVIDQSHETDVQWDRVGVVKYPTRKSFLDMQNRDDFKGMHEHKEAGMQFTFVIGCQPVDQAPELRVDTSVWASSEYSPTDDDGPVVVVEVVKYVNNAPVPSTASTQNSAQKVDGGPAAWFNVEGTIIGDGREWDQIWFNAFPSLRAYNAQASSALLSADASVFDSYTLIVRASIDTFTANGPA